MNVKVCHAGSPLFAEAGLPDVPCCYGVAEYADPARCTCWEPMYDLDQQPPQEGARFEVQRRMCGDCAYRPDSPERAEQDRTAELLELPSSGVFFCHQGLRRPVEWRHPDGRVIAGDPADYSPPVIGGVPYRANGQPAFVCGGWALVKDRLLRAETRLSPSPELARGEAAG